MTAGAHSPAMTIVFYAVGLVISYVMGFIITNATIKVEDVANA